MQYSKEFIEIFLRDSIYESFRGVYQKNFNDNLGVYVLESKLTGGYEIYFLNSSVVYPIFKTDNLELAKSKFEQLRLYHSK